MRFSVGYQPDESWIACVLERRDAVREVYFPWSDLPNGRAPLSRSGRTEESVLSDLSRFREAGLSLNLLLNGMCYGEEALSKALMARAEDAVRRTGADSVTTTSPALAAWLHGAFPAMEIRASVNIGAGSERAFDYLGDAFGGYYVKRELSRDFEAIDRLKRWCDARGKRLYLLANGGCLADCPARAFHDNLVSHEAGLSARDNVPFRGLCREYLDAPAHRVSLVRDLSFVRPEDLAFYAPWFDCVKLATRASKNPARILRAYAAGRYAGNLLSLLEPDFSAAIYPEVLENARFPADFARMVGTCGRQCAHCSYCADVYERIRLSLC